MTTSFRAIGVVRNLLAAHEADSRLMDPGVGLFNCDDPLSVCVRFAPPSVVACCVCIVLPFLCVQVRARVAALYVPLIAIVLDVSQQLHDPYAKEADAAGSNFKYVVGLSYGEATMYVCVCAGAGRVYSVNSVYFSRLSVDLESKPGVNPRVALAIAGIGSGSPPRTPLDPRMSEEQQVLRTPLGITLTRQVFQFVPYGSFSHRNNQLRVLT